MAPPVNTFISYAHADDNLFRRLLNHLSVLVQQKVLAAWHDRRIEPGQEWNCEISREMEGAQLILLLVSPSFMASEYAQGIEVKRALELHERNAARVVPVLLRYVDWEFAPIGRLQALPTNGKPVVAWRDRDDAFRDITRGIGGMLRSSEYVVAIEPPSLKRPGVEIGKPTSQESGGVEIGATGGGTVKKEATIRALATSRGELSVDEMLFLNHTSFLRAEKQQEFRSRTGVDVPHYDIRVIVDSFDPAWLDCVERVEYLLDRAYPEPIRVRSKSDRPRKFLLKELANGESLVTAKVFVEGREEPVVLRRYLTLWDSGPELP